MTHAIPTVTVHTPEGQSYEISEQPMARGTYGAICAVADRPDLAVKIFSTHTSNRRRQARLANKISDMVEAGPPAMPDHVNLAWPIAAVKVSQADDEHRIDGYLMQRMPDNHRTLAMLADHEHGTPQAQRAVELMQQATQALHDTGIMIGDLSASNAAMAAGQLWLFDTDGWQFTSRSGTMYYAEGVTYAYAHPQLMAVQQSMQANCTDPNCPYSGEIHQLTVSCRPRQKTHDNFALSRIAAQLTAEHRRKPTNAGTCRI